MCNYNYNDEKKHKRQICRYASSLSFNLVLTGMNYGGM